MRDAEQMTARTHVVEHEERCEVAQGGRADRAANDGTGAFWRLLQSGARCVSGERARNGTRTHASEDGFDDGAGHLCGRHGVLGGCAERGAELR